MSDFEIDLSKSKPSIPSKGIIYWSHIQTIIMPNGEAKILKSWTQIAKENGFEVKKKAKKKVIDEFSQEDAEEEVF